MTFFQGLVPTVPKHFCNAFGTPSKRVLTRLPMRVHSGMALGLAGHFYHRSHFGSIIVPPGTKIVRYECSLSRKKLLGGR